ncbi:MAG TPA: hypothetical protein VG097_16690, partial [Gemmata sp.]|nr:hypothetical protein [Gemmata sp.]
MTVLLDADVILIDNRYPRDPKFTRNQELLNRLKLDGHEVAITVQALLEVVGILSYITPVARIPGLPDVLAHHYGLKVIPDRKANPNYAAITIADVVSQMANQMSLNDAVQAVQIRMFVPHADALLTWNAKHFKGKMAVPVLTPEEWLQQQPPPSPTP